MSIVELSLSMYQSSAKIMYILLPLIFLGRVVYANVFGSAEDHLENLKTVVVYFLLVGGFEIVLPYLIDLPRLISSYYDVKLNLDYDEIMQAYVVSEKKSSWSFDILSVLDGFTSILESLVQILVDLLFLLLALLTPIVILLSVMLNLGVGVKLMFGLFFILATWNVAIAACEIFLKEMALNQKWEMNMFFVGFLAAAMKLLSGATNILMILKSQAASGVMKSLKMGMGALSGGASTFSATGSKGSTAYAENSYSGATSFDAKLERMPPPQTAGTFAGVARAENRIRQNEIARQDMMKARDNLGLNSKQNSSQKAQNSGGSQKSSSSISSSSSSSGSYSSDLKSSSSGNSKMESSVTSSQNSQNQSSNSDNSSSADSPKISEYSGTEAAAWSKNSENLKSMSTGDLKTAMNDFSAKKDAPITANSETDNGSYKRQIRDNTEYNRAYWNTRNELKQRQAAGDSEADEALQTGHMDRKKGRK